MKKILCLIMGVAMITLSGLASAYCPPGAIPADPAPAEKKAKSAGTNCLDKVSDSFSRGEEVTHTVNLKRGQSYWFGANGCPKMGNIRLSVADTQGKLLRKGESYSPSFCFKATSDGAYKVGVKAMTLMGSNTSGNIDSCFSESRCTTQTAK